jgi:hypothetical protein
MGDIMLISAVVVVGIGVLMGEVFWREPFQQWAYIESHRSDYRADTYAEEESIPLLQNSVPHYYLIVLLREGGRVKWEVSHEESKRVFDGEYVRAYCSRGRIFGDVIIEQVQC